MSLACRCIAKGEAYDAKVCAWWNECQKLVREKYEGQRKNFGDFWFIYVVCSILWDHDAEMTWKDSKSEKAWAEADSVPFLNCGSFPQILLGLANLGIVILNWLLTGGILYLTLLEEPQMHPVCHWFTATSEIDTWPWRHMMFISKIWRYFYISFLEDLRVIFRVSFLSPIHILSLPFWRITGWHEIGVTCFACHAEQTPSSEFHSLQNEASLGQPTQIRQLTKHLTKCIT
jgi:hypothetical protein